MIYKCSGSGSGIGDVLKHLCVKKYKNYACK